jgi:predicted helicase
VSITIENAYHLDYETVTPYSKIKFIGVEKENFIVDKIRFIEKDDKTAIQYNLFIKITGSLWRSMGL